MLLRLTGIKKDIVVLYREKKIKSARHEEIKLVRVAIGNFFKALKKIYYKLGD